LTELISSNGSLMTRNWSSLPDNSRRPSSLQLIVFTCHHITLFLVLTYELCQIH
jgi:hypothetical protein